MNGRTAVSCSEVAKDETLVHFLASALASDETIAPTEAIDERFHAFLNSEARDVIEQAFGRTFKHDPTLRGEALDAAFARTVAVFGAHDWSMCGAGSEAAMCGAGSEAAMCGAGSEAAMCGAGSQAAMCGAGTTGIPLHTSDLEGITARLVSVLEQAA